MLWSFDLVLDADSGDILDEILTNSEEKRKRRYKFGYFLLNFLFFISRAILLLWDFQISEVIITIISFMLW